MDTQKGIKVLAVSFEVLVVVVILYFGTLYGSQLLSSPDEVFSSSIYKVVIGLGVLILVIITSKIFLNKEDN